MLLLDDVTLNNKNTGKGERTLVSHTAVLSAKEKAKRGVEDKKFVVSNQRVAAFSREGGAKSHVIDKGWR